MTRWIVMAAAVLAIFAVVGCGGSGGSSSTSSPIPKAELDALEQAHSDFHSAGNQIDTAIQSCTSVGCFSGVMVRAQSAITVLDTQLQHAELAANGRCKVAIQTAQAGLLGFKATVDGIKQAIDAYDVAGIQSAGQGLAGTSKTFNDQLDSIAGACGAAAAPNA